MKPDIVTKLRQHLHGDIDSECKVVYLLCEVRKLLHKNCSDPKPFALKLYCNWAMHVDLEWKPTTIEFLKRVDAYVVNKLDPNVPETAATIGEEQALFRDFVGLEPFRTQLTDFLISHGLPTQLCEQDKRWLSFIAAYSGVIEDGSIACESKAPELKMVSKVVFSKGRLSCDPGGELSFAVRWCVHLQDGRELRIEVEAGPSKSAVFSKLTLLP